MFTAPVTSAHAMALPSPVTWKDSHGPVGSLSTSQSKIAARGEQLGPLPLTMELGGHSPVCSSPPLGQLRPCACPEVQSSGQVTLIGAGITQGHSCTDRRWHHRQRPQGGHLCAHLAAASSMPGLRALHRTRALTSFGWLHPRAMLSPGSSWAASGSDPRSRAHP